MTLIEKLEDIKQPPISKLQFGVAKTLQEFWETFIKPRLPDKEVVLKWHKTLLEYVKQENAMFAIRGYNTEAKKEDWYKLRRGWLTRTNAGYSFFYTDNFHAAYYCKMTIDGYVPTVDELIETYNARKFPSRFMRDTSEEREKIAIINGKDPGIQTAGYKIAHIINVGRDYFFKGVDQSLQNIVDRYYSRGEREDWQQVTDSTGEHWSRNNFEVVPEAKEYLIAEFLRFVHPMNYFLTPKPTCIIKTNEYKDIAEYQPLVNYVMNKFSEMYGNAYEEFLNLIMVDRDYHKEPGDKAINLKYGPNIRKIKVDLTTTWCQSSQGQGKCRIKT